MAGDKCPVCNADYTEKFMIECTRCHKRVHHVCANFNEQVASNPNWRCLACVNELLLLERNTRTLTRQKGDVPLVQREQFFPDQNKKKPTEGLTGLSHTGVVPKLVKPSPKDLIELASQRDDLSTEDGARAIDPKVAPAKGDPKPLTKPSSRHSSRRTKVSDASSQARAIAAAKLKAIEAKEELARRKTEMIRKEEALLKEQVELANERLQAELEATRADEFSDLGSESVVTDLEDANDLERWLNETQVHQADSSRLNSSHLPNQGQSTQGPSAPTGGRSRGQNNQEPLFPQAAAHNDVRPEGNRQHYARRPHESRDETRQHVSFEERQQSGYAAQAPTHNSREFEESNAGFGQRQFRTAPNDPLLNAYAQPFNPEPQTAQTGNVADPPQQIVLPTAAQLTARSSIGRRLPDFNGKPGAWPIFYSSYCESTMACGFSNRENLVRLQDHLKDPARRMVAGLLNDPRNVKEIMETLQMLYGRPERIVGDMIERVQSLAAPKEGKLEALVEYAVEVRNLSSMLKEMPNHRTNPILIEKIIEKLPSSTKVAWSERPMIDDLADTDVVEFANWLYQRAMNLCRSVPGLMGKGDDRNRRSHERVNVSLENSGSKCIFCSKECQGLIACPKFYDESVENRWKFAKSKKLCFRCLTGHNYKEACKGPRFRCLSSGCTKSHHPLLHSDRNPERNRNNPGIGIANEVPQNAGGNPNASGAQEFSGNHQQAKQTTFFRYLPVEIRYKGRSVKTLAFMDEGSSATLLSKGIAQELALEGETLPLCLKWTDGEHHKEDLNSIQANVRICGRGQAKGYSMKVRTIDDLDLPAQTLNYGAEVQQYPYLGNLPVESYKNEKPGILIGMDNWSLALPTNYKEGKRDQPIGVKCRLGWSIIKPSQSMSEVRSCHVCECHTEQSDEKLFELVKSFYALDLAGVRGEGDAPLSKEEQRALDMMKETLEKEGDRFKIGLLWKDVNSTFPDSKPMALKRLEWLEKRLERSPELAESLKKLIAEYEKKGYIRKLKPHELKEPHKRVWNLPLFPVTNPNKPGKVRPVWDAKATVGDVSLNSRLLTGPDLNTTLLDVLLKFRLHPYAASADIREMFHRVLMLEEDQHAQRFLWRNCESWREPDVYVVQVMTFGATCSPSCAQFVKNTNAEEHRHEFPEAAEAIVSCHFVDDLLRSFRSEEEAIRVAKDIVAVHAKAGFEIRNWRSNSKVLMEIMGEASGDAAPQDMDLSPEGSTEKVLGLWWKYTVDQFTFSLKYNKGNNETLQGKRCPTKREALRILMSIYDPLGLLANYLIFLKILIQDLWRIKLDWDDPIPEEQYQQFLKWVSLLPQIEKLGVPRCYLRGLEDYEGADVQLHVFTDASEHACAAVAYLRIERQGEIRCSLVMAKTKVAPIKLMSVPRLELEAAVMGVRMAKKIERALDIPLSGTHYWSDSSNVLRWLRKPEIRRLGKFVAFRVAEIQEKSDPNKWRYVPTDDNVADEGTKWVRPPTFDADSRWFTGPAFLYGPAEEWPINITRSMPEEEEEEVVIICDPAFPSDTWPKGRVLQTFPGKDGQVRAARIQTANGELTRPTTKLAKLDLGASGLARGGEC